MAILGLACAIGLSFASASAAAPKADAGAPLSKEQWAKLAKRMAEAGTTRDLPFKVAESLGLTRGAEVLTVRELAFERQGYQHGIYRSDLWRGWRDGNLRLQLSARWLDLASWWHAAIGAVRIHGRTL